MQVSLRKLSDILFREHQQYTRLLDALSVQREAIVSRNPEHLNELLKYQGTIVLELKTLEEARTALMRKLARSYGIPASEVTLTQIAEYAEEPYASEYHRYAQRLRQLVQQLEQLCQENGYLLDRSLDHVNSMLRMLTSAQVAQGGDYSHMLQSRPRVEPGKLLCEMA